MSSLKVSRSDPQPLITSRAELANRLGVDRDFISQVASAPNEWYTAFDVPKVSGGMRIIRPPRKRLRQLQRKLLMVLYSRLPIGTYLHGGLPRRSVLTHARPHVGRRMVATLDVKNFFPSVRPGLVAKVFEQAGVIGDALPDAIVLTTLDEGLPQGAPTSCLLANLAFSSVDVQMIDLCRRRKLSYTRYVDDIAVSGNTSFQDLRGPFIDRIRSAGFEVADEKVHFLPAGERQVVTGLVVNAKLRPTKIFIEQLKNDIRLCVDRGPQMLAEIEGLSVRAVKSRLTGRATHVAMADPVLGRRLRGMLCGVAWSKSADAANGIFSSELAEATANL